MVNSIDFPAVFSLFNSLNEKCAWHDAYLVLKPPQLFDFSVHGLMHLSIGIRFFLFVLFWFFPSAVTWISFSTISEKNWDFLHFLKDSQRGDEIEFLT